MVEIERLRRWVWAQESKFENEVGLASHPRWASELVQGAWGAPPDGDQGSQPERDIGTPLGLLAK
ncbi:hypothetical protein PPTG_22389 [Phytophthora nicotianae INRA-310]|uniref:Uncharacterized protein n=1 Tax=Phytophthora nicotianae (strain INRA-310) TaxID=761204 RepID=W2QHP0_PHYN3|nr:hypothetical protein PPTG_22389 [Phytophthora nicotianae INRA-310]ETN12692.1 hypothetical protein PPTG_22389 [Phytophthora nicotianae INRA-310]